MFTLKNLARKGEAEAGSLANVNWYVKYYSVFIVKDSDEVRYIYSYSLTLDAWPLGDVDVSLIVWFFNTF